MSLPNDVIFDILSRLPASSLRPCRCVSRGWRALISDPAFLAAHKSRRPDLLLIDTSNFRGHKEHFGGYKDHDLRLRDLSGNVVRVIEGVGGSDILPAMSLEGLACVIAGPLNGIHLVDLATGKVVSTIPTLEVTKQMHDFVACQYETFGIGRTASSGVYKVVWLVQGDTCQVLTFGGDTRWRTKTHSSDEYFLDRYCSPVTISGVMYFLTEGTSGTLLCFDLENEEWKDAPIKGPSELVGAKMWNPISVHMIELNGFVCLVQEEYNDVSMFRHSHDSSTNVWIMDDFGKTNWTKVYTIPLRVSLYTYMPLRVMHGGEKLLVECASRYEPKSSSFGLYDPHTKTCTNIMSVARQCPTTISPAKIVLCNLNLEHLASVNN